MFNVGDKVTYINDYIANPIVIEQIVNGIAIATSGSFGDMGPFSMTFDASTGKGVKEYAGTRIVKMRATSNFIEKLNVMRLFASLDPIAFPTSFEESKIIFKRLGLELDPERLHADGERSSKEAQDRYDMLREVWTELEDVFGMTVDDTEEWMWK